MLTQQQLEEIDDALKRGVTPEMIAKHYGLSRSGLGFQLLNSGKRIVINRCLVDTAPAKLSAGSLVDTRA